MGGEPADGGAVEGEVFVGAEQEFLVVVEQVKPSFKVREQHGDSLDPLFVGQVLQALLANGVGRGAFCAISLGCQVELFQLFVGESEEIAILSRHGSPFFGDSWRKGYSPGVQRRWRLRTDTFK